MTLHQAYAAQLGASVIAGLTNLSQDLNPTVDNEVGIGTLFPQFVVMRGQKPSMAFATRDVASLLALTGSTGADIGAGNTFIGYFAKMDKGRSPLAGSVHRSYTMANGVLVPRTLSCQHQQDAQVDSVAAALSADGLAHPLAVSDAVALPTVPRDNNRWTLGPVTVGGVSVGRVTSISVDFGVATETEGDGSNLYDTFFAQPGTQPTITISGLDATALAAAGIPFEGKAGTHANTTIYLRKRAANGIGFIPNGDLSAPHIKIDADGLAVVQQHSGQGPRRGEISLVITCGWDGTNAPIGVTTGTTIV